MENIPQDVLHSTYQSALTDAPHDFLRSVANDFTDAADKVRALRKKSWQSTSKELDTVAGHIVAYAEQLAVFAENNPDGVTLVDDEPAEQSAPSVKAKNAKPELPNNTGRCASFRRADADDKGLCVLDKGHPGDHTSPLEGGPVVWPRQHSGNVCGDVVVLPGGTSLNCARPLGHDGDEHGSDDYTWPRGVGTSRPVSVVQPEPPLTVDDELFPGQCAARQDDERCMLPGTHTGKHKGRKGTGWDREPATATLGDIADHRMRELAIPAQRPESDPAPIVVHANSADAGPTVLAPGAVIVAEMKEEVSATVSELSNPFAPIVQTVSIGPGPTVAWTISGSTEPETPAAPRAEFLPPHLVPGAPRERYSVSSVDAMADCGLKFRLKYRDGVASTNISWASVGGKAFHEVVRIIEAEHADDGRWSTDAALLEQERDAATLWKQTFADEIDSTEERSGVKRAAWRATNGGREDYAWWVHSGEDMVRRYIRWRVGFLAEGWTLLRQPGGAPAQEIEFDVSVDGVMNKGFIDAAWINVDTGTIRVVDYKTGTSDNKPFQLRTYGHALRALGALDGYTVQGSFYDARKAQWTGEPLLLTPDDDAEVSYRFNSTAAADRAGIFLARPSSFCGGCEVKASCPIMAKKG